MKLTGFEIFRYELPLQFPLTVGAPRPYTRAGLLIRLKSDNGCSGYGEAAPLPGLNRENLHQVTDQLKQVRLQLVGDVIPGNVNRLQGEFEHWLGKYELFPSARFALELAFLNLLADASDQPLHQLLIPGNIPQPLLIHGLLSGSPESIYRDARKMTKKGYRAFKLKVARRSVRAAMYIVESVRKIIGHQAVLRLDANREWSFEDAVEFGRTAAGFNIDYIEEPFGNPAQFRDFFNRTGIPVALDETLMSLDAEKLIYSEAIKAFILKPGVLGGVEKIFRMAREGRGKGVIPVLSCPFYSGIGLLGMAGLAAALMPPGIPAGLDTGRWFKEDLLVQPVAINNGMLDTQALSAASTLVRSELLQPV